MSFFKPSKKIEPFIPTTISKSMGEGISRTVLSPAETSEYLSHRMQYRVHNSILNMLLLSFLAGIFTAFGASLYLYVLADPIIGTYHLSKLLAAFCFSTGLIMITFSGGELVTGAVLSIMPVIRKEMKISNFVIYLSVILVGNIAGVLSTVAIMHCADLFNDKNQLKNVAIALAEYKTSLSFMQAFLLAILCNMCVCLAIWSSHASLTPSGKVLAVALPITLFATVGFEHIVANLFFLPVGFLYMDYSFRLIESIFTHNLIPVFLGNMLGGILFASIMVFAHYPKSKN